LSKETYMYSQQKPIDEKTYPTYIVGCKRYTRRYNNCIVERDLYLREKTYNRDM